VGAGVTGVSEMNEANEWQRAQERYECAVKQLKVIGKPPKNWQKLW
jgi:hypothetical protein